MSDTPSEVLTRIAQAVTVNQKCQGAFVLTMGPGNFGVFVPEEQRDALMERLPQALREMADSLQQMLDARQQPPVEIEPLPGVLPEECWCGMSREIGFGEPCQNFRNNLDGFCLGCKHPEECHS